MGFEGAAERVYRLERSLDGLVRGLGEVQLRTRALAQQFREAEAEASLFGGMAGRLGGGGQGSGATEVVLRAVTPAKSPIAGATVSFDLTYLHGLDEVGGRRVNLTTDADGLARYELTTLDVTHGGYSGPAREVTGYDAATDEDYDSDLNGSLTAAGWSGVTRVVGPFLPTKARNDLVVPGAVTLAYLGVATGWRYWTLVDRPATARMRLTDQFVADADMFGSDGSFSVPGVYNTTRGGRWSTRYTLTTTADGGGGYQLTVRTIDGFAALPTLTESFNTSSIGVAGGKLRVTYDLAGSTTAGRIYPTGSTAVTLDEP